MAYRGPIVARFGDNLRAIRLSLNLNQEDLAPRLRTARGAAMKQSNLSRLEASEGSPRPPTVKRLAEGIAAISGRSVQAEVERLLDGVPSRFDAVQEQRALATRVLLDDQLRAMVDGLPTGQKSVFNKAMEAHARRLLRTINKARPKVPPRKNSA
jgi:transcriptional regulator with XRE-family HTH domain